MSARGPGVRPPLLPPGFLRLLATVPALVRRVRTGTAAGVRARGRRAVPLPRPPRVPRGRRPPPRGHGRARATPRPASSSANTTPDAKSAPRGGSTAARASRPRAAAARRRASRARSGTAAADARPPRRAARRRGHAPARGRRPRRHREPARRDRRRDAGAPRGPRRRVARARVPPAPRARPALPRDRPPHGRRPRGARPRGRPWPPGTVLHLQDPGTWAPPSEGGSRPSTPSPARDAWCDGPATARAVMAPRGEPTPSGGPTPRARQASRACRSRPSPRPRTCSRASRSGCRGGAPLAVRGCVGLFSLPVVMWLGIGASRAVPVLVRRCASSPTRWGRRPRRAPAARRSRPVARARGHGRDRARRRGAGPGAPAAGRTVRVVVDDGPAMAAQGLDGITAAARARAAVARLRAPRPRGRARASVISAAAGDDVVAAARGGPAALRVVVSDRRPGLATRCVEVVAVGTHRAQRRLRGRGHDDRGPRAARVRRGAQRRARRAPAARSPGRRQRRDDARRGRGRWWSATIDACRRGPVVVRLDDPDGALATDDGVRLLPSALRVAVAGFLAGLLPVPRRHRAPDARRGRARLGRVAAGRGGAARGHVGGRRGDRGEVGCDVGAAPARARRGGRPRAGRRRASRRRRCSATTWTPRPRPRLRARRAGRRRGPAPRARARGRRDRRRGALRPAGGRAAAGPSTAAWPILVENVVTAAAGGPPRARRVAEVVGLAPPDRTRLGRATWRGPRRRRARSRGASGLPVAGPLRAPCRRFAGVRFRRASFGAAGDGGG